MTGHWANTETFSIGPVLNAKQQDVNDAVGRHPHSGNADAPAMSTSRQKDGRHLAGVERLNGQVRSAVDVRMDRMSPGAAAAASAADGPTSRRARRLHERAAAANRAKSHSVSSLTTGADATVPLDGGRRLGSGDGRRALQGGSEDRLVSSLDSTSGRCVSESRLNAAI